MPDFPKRSPYSRLIGVRRRNQRNVDAGKRRLGRQFLDCPVLVLTGQDPLRLNASMRTTEGRRWGFALVKNLERLFSDAPVAPRIAIT